MNKIYLFLVFSILTTIGMAQEKTNKQRGDDQLGIHRSQIRRTQ